MHLNVNNIIIVPWTPRFGGNMLKHLWYDLCRFNPENLWTRLPLDTLDDFSRPMVYRLDSLLPDAK